MRGYYLAHLLYNILQSDRLVLWTWGRMMKKTRLEWQGDYGSSDLS